MVLPTKFQYLKEHRLDCQALTVIIGRRFHLVRGDKGGNYPSTEGENYGKEDVERDLRVWKVIMDRKSHRVSGNIA